MLKHIAEQTDSRGYLLRLLRPKMTFLKVDKVSVIKKVVIVGFVEECLWHCVLYGRKQLRKNKGSAFHTVLYDK